MQFRLFCTLFAAASACDITCTLVADGVDNVIKVNHGTELTATAHRCFITESNDCTCLCDEDWSTATSTSTSFSGSLSTFHPGHANNQPLAPPVTSSFPFDGEATLQGVTLATAQTNAFQNAFVAGLCALTQEDVSSFQCSSIAIVSIESSSGARRLLQATSGSVAVKFTIYTASPAEVTTLNQEPIVSAALVAAVADAYTGGEEVSALKCGFGLWSPRFHVGEQGEQCAAGTAVVTSAECQEALAYIGNERTVIDWAGSTNSIPNGCVVKATVHHGNPHFNANTGNANGRDDMVPICTGAKPTATEGWYPVINNNAFSGAPWYKSDCTQSTNSNYNTCQTSVWPFKTYAVRLEHNGATTFEVSEIELFDEDGIKLTPIGARTDDNGKAYQLPQININFSNHVVVWFAEQVTIKTLKVVQHSNPGSTTSNAKMDWKWQQYVGGTSTSF